MKPVSCALGLHTWSPWSVTKKNPVTKLPELFGRTCQKCPAQQSGGVELRIVITDIRTTTPSCACIDSVPAAEEACGNR